MSTAVRVVVVPGPPALLPEHAGLVDPLGPLRSACRESVAWLLADDPSRVVVLCSTESPGPADPGPGSSGAGRSRRPYAADVADHLLRSGGFGGDLDLAGRLGQPPSPVPDGGVVLVVADGTARRGVRAPGHLDERSFAFDKTIEVALGSGDRERLAGLDDCLGRELLAEGVPALRALGRTVGPVQTAQVVYADDPYGVMYWVVRWTCAC